MGVDVEMGPPRLKDRPTGRSRAFNVFVAIDLSGSTEGTVVLRFPNTVALALIAGLTGEDARELDAGGYDALGEIANMVVGNAKKDFPHALARMSTPRVGTEDVLKRPPVLVLPFETGRGRFLVEVKLRAGPPAPPRVPTAEDAEVSRIADAILG